MLYKIVFEFIIQVKPQQELARDYFSMISGCDSSASSEISLKWDLGSNCWEVVFLYLIMITCNRIFSSKVTDIKFNLGVFQKTIFRVVMLVRP